MNLVGYARSYRDLVVYQKARRLAKRVFEITREFPREEMFCLTSQVRRSSRSIGGQIAEAWGKRRYPRHFVSKLTDADAEGMETQHWVDTALDCDYLSPVVHDELLDRLDEIGRMLDGMMRKSESFCGEPSSHVREEIEPYFATRRAPG